MAQESGADRDGFVRELTQNQAKAFSPDQEQHKWAFHMFRFPMFRAISQAFQPHYEDASLGFANGYFYENWVLSVTSPLGNFFKV